MGGNGGTGGALEREAMEAEEERSLKRVVKIMKTNGKGVSGDGEENFICEVSSPGICCATATPQFRDRGEPEPGKLRRRKMRALIVIIVQGQLFPRWSKSC